MVAFFWYSAASAIIVVLSRERSSLPHDWEPRFAGGLKRSQILTDLFLRSFPEKMMAIGWHVPLVGEEGPPFFFFLEPPPLIPPRILHV